MKFFEGKPEDVGINLEAERQLGIPASLYDNVDTLVVSLADYAVAIEEVRDVYVYKLFQEAFSAEKEGKQQESKQIIEKARRIQQYFTKNITEIPEWGCKPKPQNSFLKKKQGR